MLRTYHTVPPNTDLTGDRKDATFSRLNDVPRPKKKPKSKDDVEKNTNWMGYRKDATVSRLSIVSLPNSTTDIERRYISLMDHSKDTTSRLSIVSLPTTNDIEKYANLMGHGKDATVDRIKAVPLPKRNIQKKDHIENGSANKMQDKKIGGSV